MGADVVGIQEARDRHDSHRSGLHFDVFAAAAATDMVVSNLGYTKKQGVPANKIRVTGSSSRHTLATIRCPSLRLDFWVGHAPVQDEHGRQEKWWQEVTAMIQGRPQPRAELVALIDANGRVGSIASQAVGHVEPLVEDAGGELLHDFLGKCGLLAANTFDGTGRRTWVPTRGQEARLDCVVCPQRWLPMLQRAGTADFVLRDDGGMTDEGKSDKDRITFDRARLGQEECREYFCQLLACAPPTPDDVAVDDHERLLTTFWRQCLTQACQRPECGARNKWYSHYTWTQILMARHERGRFFW